MKTFAEESYSIVLLKILIYEFRLQENIKKLNYKELI